MNDSLRRCPTASLMVMADGNDGIVVGSMNTSTTMPTMNTSWVMPPLKLQGMSFRWCASISAVLLTGNDVGNY